jgi:hypothetical protein
VTTKIGVFLSAEQLDQMDSFAELWRNWSELHHQVVLAERKLTAQQELEQRAALKLQGALEACQAAGVQLLIDGDSNFPPCKEGEGPYPSPSQPLIAPPSTGRSSEPATPGAAPQLGDDPERPVTAAVSRGGGRQPAAGSSTEPASTSRGGSGERN